MSISLKNRSLISISDYTPEEICHVLDIAEDFEKNPHQNLLNGRIIASLFFEPSTRTRLSFETAIQLLGGNVIGFSSTSGTGMSRHSRGFVYWGYSSSPPAMDSSKWAWSFPRTPGINRATLSISTMAGNSPPVRM